MKLKDQLEIDGKNVSLENEVRTSIDFGEVYVVLFEPGGYKSKFGQFRNLVGLDRNGERTWTAELPTNTSSDCYCDIFKENDGLKAHSFSCFQCQIDIATGRIMNRSFTK